MGVLGVPLLLVANGHALPLHSGLPPFWLRPVVQPLLNRFPASMATETAAQARTSFDLKSASLPVVAVVLKTTDAAQFAADWPSAWPMPRAFLTTTRC
jgi:hypothetical protein